MAQHGASLRVEADIAAAYPKAAGLTTFRRVFAMEPGRFVVDDEVATTTARPVEWAFHSGVPIRQEEGGFVLGGTPGLLLTIEGQAQKATIEPTLLMAPGKPGSITVGAQERRGFHVKVQAAPATSIRLRSVLSIQRE